MQVTLWKWEILKQIKFEMLYTELFKFDSVSPLIKQRCRQGSLWPFWRYMVSKNVSIIHLVA